MLKKNITRANSTSRLIRACHYLFPSGSRLFIISVVVLYALINLVILLHHEPWRDEAQAWLIARDSSFFDMFRQLRFEGHPALWYLILYPIAHFGLPYVFLGYVSLSLMTMTAYLIARFAPFHTHIKLFAIFSAMCMYYYPVISRSYALVALLTVILCILHSRRLRYPILYGASIALLLQTHLWAYGLASALYILFLFDVIKERVHIKLRDMVIGLSLPIISLGFASLILVGGGNSTGFAIQVLSGSDIVRAVVDFFTTSIQTPYTLATLGFVIMVLISITLLSICKRAFFVFIMSIAVPLAIVVFVYGTILPQRALLVLLFLFCSMWIAYDTLSHNRYTINHPDSIAFYHKPLLYVSFILITSLTIPTYSSAVADDLKYPYSSGESIGRYIHDNLPSDAIMIVPVESPSIAAAAPYTYKTQRFYSTSYGGYLTYMKWNQSATLASKDTSQQVAAILSHNQHVYALLWSDSGQPPSDVPAWVAGRPVIFSQFLGRDGGVLYPLSQ